MQFESFCYVSKTLLCSTECFVMTGIRDDHIVFVKFGNVCSLIDGRFEIVDSISFFGRYSDDE